MVLECASSDLMLLEPYDVGLTMGILRSFGLVVELVARVLHGLVPLINMQKLHF